MAKTKETEDKSFSERLKALDKKYEFNTSPQDTFYISTGSFKLDCALGGFGHSSRRITELIAWEGVGKTTLALLAIKDAMEKFPEKHAVYIDSEHSLDKDYAKKLGVDWDKLIIRQPNNGEEAFEYGKELISSGEVSLIVFDSVSGLLPKKQIEDPAGSVNMGLHARLMGQEIPKIKNLISEKNTCAIFISQVREKIGVMFGSPETTQGGNALKFWASNRIELRNSEQIKNGDSILGKHVKFKTIKCKTSAPLKTDTFPLYFGKGIDKYEEIIEMLKEYEIIKIWGKTVTFLETKLEYDVFLQNLKEDFEVYTLLTEKIKEKAIF